MIAFPSHDTHTKVVGKGTLLLTVTLGHRLAPTATILEARKVVLKLHTDSYRLVWE